MNHHLALSPSSSDETLALLRYLTFPAASEAAVGAVMEHGLRVREGEATISAALVNSEGYQVILRRPRQPYLGFATLTSAILDRAQKTVSGSPLGYARARRELGWYLSASLVAKPGAESVNLTVSSDFLVGWTQPTVTLVASINQLDVAAKLLTPLQFGPIEEAIAEAIVLAPGVTQLSASEPAHALVVSTLESSVLEQMRNLRWQGLSLLGYHFSERGQGITVAPAESMNDQQQRLNGLQERLNGESLLMGELAWLRPHVQSLVTIMNNELRDPLPDSPL